MRICFLEDSFTLTRDVCATLSDAGHDVDHYSVPEEALYAILKNDYDFFLASQYEPRDGLDCAGLLRTLRMAADPGKRQITRVILTTDGSTENVKSLTLAGANRVIVRGAGKTTLTDQILEALDIGKSGYTRKNSRQNPGGKTAAKTPARQVRRADGHTDEHARVGIQHMWLSDHTGANKRQAALPVPTKSRSISFRRPKALYAIPATIIIVAAIATWIYLRESVPVEVVAVQQGTLVKSINGNGRVISKKEVDLTSPVSGQLYEVYVDEGMKVKKGKVLAKLDDREANVNIKRAEAKLLVADEELAFAERTLTQLSELQEKALANRLANERTENAGIVAADPQFGQQADAVVTSEMPNVEELAEKLKSAQAAVIAAKSKQLLAKEDVRAMRLARDRLKITAPFSGVVARSFAVEGLWAQPSTVLFTLVDTAQREVAITVDPEDAQDVAVGQTVRMASPAFPGLEWKEKVIRIAARSKRTRTASNGSTIAFASLGDSAPPVRYGQIIDAQVITESRPNTLKLPFEAVIDRDGRHVIGHIEDNRIHYRTIETGLRALTDIEILSGLTLGELVVLPRQPLEEGQRVAPTILPEHTQAEGFPLREKYPDVAIYSTEQLRRNYYDVLVVDVRSQFEYDIVHVEKATNIPIASEHFTKDLQTLRPKSSTKPIIFYCNGHTCAKSYKAVRKAANDGFKHIYAYDSGIFDWMKASRDKTSLLGKTPAPISNMVSQEYFQSRLIDFESFKKKSKRKNTLVIDVRDEMQRKTTMTIPAIELPLDKFIEALNSDRFKGKQLLIFDAVGKQVRWLQYILEDRGYKDYFFLRKGISSV